MVIARYFERIKIPEKDLIVLDNSGHDPNGIMLEKQLEVLTLGYNKHLVKK